MLLHQRANIRKPTCELVSEFLQKNCCGFFSANGCWVPGFVNPIIQKNGHTTRQLPAVTEAVVQAIQDNRVAILSLESITQDKMGHYAVVYGVENLDRPEKMRFFIYDPGIGEVKASPSELRTRYEISASQAFRWAHTIVIAD